MSTTDRTPGETLEARVERVRDWLQTGQRIKTHWEGPRCWRVMDDNVEDNIRCMEGRCEPREQEPPCDTCGGTGEIDQTLGGGTANHGANSYTPTARCPDCREQEPPLTWHPPSERCARSDKHPVADCAHLTPQEPPAPGGAVEPDAELLWLRHFETCSQCRRADPRCHAGQKLYATAREQERCSNCGHTVPTGGTACYVCGSRRTPPAPGETRPECPDCGTEEEWHNLHLYRLGLEIAMDGLIHLLDGQTEPLHPVSWLTTLEKAKRARAGTLEGCAAAPTGEAARLGESEIIDVLRKFASEVDAWRVRFDAAVEDDPDHPKIGEPSLDEIYNRAAARLLRGES